MSKYISRLVNVNKIYNVTHSNEMMESVVSNEIRVADQVPINSRTDEFEHALIYENMIFFLGKIINELLVKILNSKTAQNHNVISMII